MPNSQPDANGDRFPDLEEIDSSELNLVDEESIPFVEAASIKKPGFGFFKALLWCVIFLLVTQGLLGAAIAGCLAVIVLSSGIDPKTLDINSPLMQGTIKVATLLAPICGALFSILVLRWVVGKDWPRRIGLRMPNLEHVVLVLIAFPAFEVVVSLIEPIIVRKLPGIFNMDELMKTLNSWPWWLSVTAIAIGPGISEELWCRGFLGWGLSARYGFPTGVVLTSFLFGLIHIHPQQAIVAMLLGSLLHLIYLCTRSLWVPILLHFLHNALLVLNDSTTLRVPFHRSLELAVSVEPVWFPISAAILALVTGLALYQNRVRVWLPSGLAASSSSRALIPTQLGVSLLPRPLHPLLVVAVVFSAALFGWMWLGL